MSQVQQGAGLIIEEEEQPKMTRGNSQVYAGQVQEQVAGNELVWQYTTGTR